MTFSLSCVNNIRSPLVYILYFSYLLLQFTVLCTSPFRHYCCGDLHHPVHSGVPHPLHVPPQGHLPHQWGQRRGVLGVGRHGHHWNRPQLHRDHRWEQEGVVHLAGWGQNVQTLSDSIRMSRNLGSSFAVQAEKWIGLYILNSLSILSIVVGRLQSPLHI